MENAEFRIFGIFGKLGAFLSKFVTKWQNDLAETRTGRRLINRRVESYEIN